MSIIPASPLSRSDVNRLGNNLGRPRELVAGSGQTFQRRLISAVNCSLATLGDKVSDLDPAGYLTQEGGGRGH